MCIREIVEMFSIYACPILLTNQTLRILWLSNICFKHKKLHVTLESKETIDETMVSFDIYQLLTS